MLRIYYYGKKNTLRLYNNRYHPLYDIEDGVPIINNSTKLNKILHEEKKIKNENPKKIIDKFFFKYDKQAHIRLNKYLKNI